MSTRDFISLQLIHQAWSSQQPLVIPYNLEELEYGDEQLNPGAKINGHGEVVKIQSKYLLCSPSHIYTIASDPKELRLKDHSMLYYENCSVLKLGHEYVVVLKKDCILNTIECHESLIDSIEVTSDSDLLPHVKRKYTDLLSTEPEEIYSAKQSKILRLLDSNSIVDSAATTFSTPTNILDSLLSEQTEKDWDRVEIEEVAANNNITQLDEDDSDGWADFDVDDDTIKAATQAYNSSLHLQMNHIPNFEATTKEDNSTQGNKLFDLQGEKATPSINWKKMDLEF